jgi:hypothetical protein
MGLNPFEALAAQQLTATAKRQHAAAEKRAAKSVVMSEAEAPMKGTPAEEARDVRNAQMANYRRHKARERDELVNGPYGAKVGSLLAFLKAMTPDSSDALVTIAGAAWIKSADLNTRYLILGIIADAIMKLRIRNGLPPFDDAIFDEPKTAFQLIRYDLMGV